MSYPGILRRLFENEGAGPDLREDILPDSVRNTPQPGTSAPKAPGSAAAGASARYAREDHVHPAQTTISGNAQSADTAQTCTGNAATATKLQTARMIAADDNATTGASFDGSKNVSMGIPVTVAAGTAANTLPGTDTLSLRAWLTVARNCLAWLGARFNANGAALTAVTATNATNATTAGTCTGNAATATKLATVRSICTNLASTAAANFDGSANATPGVSGVLPITNGGTGATTAAAARTALGITSGAPMPKAASGVGQWYTILVTGGAVVRLPAGGSWAWNYNRALGDGHNEYLGGDSGVSSGGSTIAPTADTRVVTYGFAWRIA